MLELDELFAGFRFPAGVAVCKSAENVVTKSVDADVQPVEDAENPNGEFLLVLSRDNLDRDRENLYADEWMHPLPAKIHMDTDHAFAQGMSVPHTAGSGVPSINEDGDLIVRGTFAGTPHGQLTRQLVNEGHVWQASVAYQTHMLDDGRVVRELLNGTFTGVPANPEAVVLSSKGARSRKAPRALAGQTMQRRLGAEDDGALSVYDDVDELQNSGGNSDSDGGGLDLMQAIHDVAVALGAECVGSLQATAAKSKKVVRCAHTGTRPSAAVGRSLARLQKFRVDQAIALSLADADQN